ARPVGQHAAGGQPGLGQHHPLHRVGHRRAHRLVAHAHRHPAVVRRHHTFTVNPQSANKSRHLSWVQSVGPRARVRAMRTKVLLVPLFLVAAATASHAADPKLAFDKYKLPNGLEVILSEDHRVPVVHVQVWYHVGSKDEQPGKTGFAHLFEHMMFQSARDLPEDTWFKKLEAVGGYGINGSTHTEGTNYFESVPANHLE